MDDPARVGRFEQIAAEDWVGRREAAVVAWRAYTWCGTAAVCATVVVPIAAVVGAVTSGWSGAVVEVVVMVPVTFLLWGAVTGVLVYFQPSKPGRRLYSVCTDTARAVVVLTPDTRRRAVPGDLLAGYLAASPKRAGAASLLDDQLDAIATAEGAHLTLTATPCLAPAYRRRGFVDDGRTAGVMQRMVRPPRAG